MAVDFSAAARAQVERIPEILLSPGSMISLPSLASALAIAMLIVSLRRRPGRRWVRPRVWLRALFPRTIIAAASTRADVGFMLLNLFATITLIGWALLTAGEVGDWVKLRLTDAFGAAPPTGLPQPLVAPVATVALFLAYEAAYWLDHYTSHKIPFFWAFHKAHHTAEVLTPLTTFRMHPIDSLKFGNITAIVIGLTAGLLGWTFGAGAKGYVLGGANLLLVVCLFTVVHLQHTHFWIAATGVWGRLLMSPAHHQIHHSSDPRHFDRNFGAGLAVWDWMFGTLHAPGARREKIVFGAGVAAHRPHSVTGCLITPFVEAAASLGLNRVAPNRDSEAVQPGE